LRSLEAAIRVGGRLANASGARIQFLLQKVPGNALYAMQSSRNNLIGYVRGSAPPIIAVGPTLGSIYAIGDQVFASPPGGTQP
jgi:hypothetical protein